MAEQGRFRSAINGFNKSDVLEYIDSIKAHHAEELGQLQQQFGQLQKSFSDNVTEANQLKNQNECLSDESTELKDEITRLQQTLQDRTRYASDLKRLSQEVEILHLEKKELTDRISHMQEKVTAAERLERQVQELRDKNLQFNKDNKNESLQLEEAGRAISELKEENQKLSLEIQAKHAHVQELEMQTEKQQKQNEQLNERIKNLENSNKRNDSLVGDAGAFIMEMYSMGQRFLEIAYKRSDGSLNEMELSLTSLSEQMSKAREQVKSARQELLDYGALAGLRLDELMQTLEESSGILSNDSGNVESAGMISDGSGE